MCWKLNPHPWVQFHGKRTKTQCNCERSILARNVLDTVRYCDSKPENWNLSMQEEDLSQEALVGLSAFGHVGMLWVPGFKALMMLVGVASSHRPCVQNDEHIFLNGSVTIYRTCTMIEIKTHPYQKVGTQFFAASM